MKLHPKLKAAIKKLVPKRFRVKTDVEINLPERSVRTTTALFKRTRLELIARGGVCFICGKPSTPTDPLEAHHHPIERCFAESVDWAAFRRDCESGMWGPRAQVFDWSSFTPADPWTFVDDMRVNGVLLCKNHHTDGDSGIHTIPYPLWVIQRYLPEGYQFTDNEIIDRR